MENERQTMIVLDFGGQYNQLIARRVREHNVYCELLPYTTPTEKLLAKKPIGIIFTGGPSSVFDEGAPRVDDKLLEAGVPVLGICYGCQLIADMTGGVAVMPQRAMRSTAKASPVRKKAPTFCNERTLSSTTATGIFSIAANSPAEGRFSSSLVILRITYANE